MGVLDKSKTTRVQTTCFLIQMYENNLDVDETIPTSDVPVYEKQGKNLVHATVFTGIHQLASHLDNIGTHLKKC